MNAAICIFVLCLLFTPKAFAKSLLIPSDTQQKIETRGYWQEIVQAVDPLTLDQTTLEKLETRPLRSDHMGRVDHTVRLLLTLENASAQNISRVLHFELLFANSIRLIQVSEHASVLGTTRPREDLSGHRFPTFYMNLKPGKMHLILEIKPSIWYVAVNGYLQTPEQYMRNQWRMDALISGVFFLIFGIIIFNLLMAAVLKNWIYAVYASYLFSYFYTCAYIEGILTFALPDWLPAFFIRQLPTLCSHLGYLSCIVFISQFLDFRTTQPRLTRVQPFLVVMFVFGLILAIFGSPWSHILFAYVYPIVAAVYIFAVIRAAFSGSLASIIFALSWAGVLGAQMLTTPIYSGHMEYDHWLLMINHMAVAGESVLFSVALAVRFQEQQRKNQKQIESLNAELQLQDKQRILFFHNISHELRTPLNGILGYVALMQKSRSKSTHENQIAMEAPQKIQHLAEHLKQQVNAILAIAKYESRGLETFAQPILIEAIAKDLRVLFDGLAVQQSALTYSIDAEGASSKEWTGDRDKLLVIINNLASNACKFSDPKRPNYVSVRFRIDPENRLHIAVSDTGIGVPLDQQKVIFQAFRQVEMNLNRRYEGTGIGLALVKSYVEVWGGELQFESQVGVGSHFLVMLPELEQGPVATVYEDSKEAMKVPPALALTPSPGGVPASSIEDSQDFKGVSILVVDDRLENREVLGQLLRSEGALVCEAASALEAKVFLERQHFDLVLLDIMMPEVNGFEFMEQLKRSETIFQSSFIVLSALAENEIRLQALEKGALDVITKPFDLNEMRFRLLNSLARLRYVQNRERSSAELQLRQFTDMTSELSHEIKNLILCDKDEVQQMIGHLCLNLKQEDGNWNEIKQALTSMKTCRYDLAEKRYHELQSLFRPDDREVRRFIRLVSDIDTLANSRALIQEVQAMDQLDRQRINGLLRTSLYLFDQLERQTSLKDLVYHMLEFSRKSSNSEQTDILGLINSCLALQKRRFQAAAIEVTVKGESIAGTWPMHTIRQVFINLMNNAIDALQSLEGEHKLQVELGIQNSTLEIVVRDNGPGIRAGWEEKIWLRHASTKTHQAGYGLGLGFARELIRQQGGDLVLRRASHPTEFLLTVPLSESKDWRKVS